MSKTRFGTTARQGDLLEPRNIEIVAARQAQQTAEELARKRAAAFDAMETALGGLLGWGRDHLSPLHNTEAHPLLLAAHHALEQAKECRK